MVHRIEKIIKEKNVSMGQFADLLEVQRSGLSHILSGRNNPSLHFVKRILEIYPEINSRWLLFGEGEMYLKDFKEQPSEVLNISPQNQEPIRAVKQQKKEVKETPIIEKGERLIEKVLIFYSDKTFEVSYPQKNENKL